MNIYASIGVYGTIVSFQETQAEQHCDFNKWLIYQDSAWFIIKKAEWDIHEDNGTYHYQSNNGSKRNGMCNSEVGLQD